jgi:hypothetical protein
VGCLKLTSWIKENPKLHASEISTVHKRFPDVRVIEHQGRLLLEGPFPALDDAGAILRQYRLLVAFPQDYPSWIPDTFMQEPHVKHIAARHIFSKNGRACLCLIHEVPNYFPTGSRFDTYFERLLRPWLIGQAYYDENGKWPWPARPHNKEGILEGLGELIGLPGPEVIENFAQLLVRKNRAGGHELCPCSSGDKLRNCHRELYNKCRDVLPERALLAYRQFLNASPAKSVYKGNGA